MDRVLIYSVKQGWSPLCKFLQKDVPKTDFPWLNRNGQDIDSYMDKHHYTEQIKNELLLIVSVLFVMLSFVFIFIVL